MKEVCEALVETISGLDGVSHASVVTPNRRVIATAGAGNTLQSDNTWRALADTFNLLDLNKLPSQRLYWRFGASTIVAQQAEGFTLGVVVETARLKTITPDIDQAVSDFLASLPQPTKTAG